MERMTSTELHDSLRKGLDELSRKLANGNIDGAGRFWTDEELERGAATSGSVESRSKSEESAA